MHFTEIFVMGIKTTIRPCFSPAMPLFPAIEEK